MISVLLDENPGIELTDMDGTNLVRMLHASAKKAVGERIIPAMDNRKLYYNKGQKVFSSFLPYHNLVPFFNISRTA
jgi:cohesin complex subunit SA-1/2